MEPNERQLDTYPENEDRDIVSDFRSWIQELPARGYRQVAVMSRRASCLLEAARKEFPGILPDYVTENGLLLLAEEFARSYEETGAFPRIAVVDDILVYGRNMNLFMSRFWNTVRQCLPRPDADAEAAFLRSADLWVYAVNDAPILLRHEFQWNMRNRKRLAESQWRALSDSIARSIAAGDVARTSYVVSAKLPYGPGRYRPDPASWHQDGETRYRDNGMCYEFYLFSPAPDGVYPSVRSYRKGDFLYFTPHLFLTGLDWTRMVRVLKAALSIAYREDPEAANGCIHLLNRIKERPARMTAYAQLASLLLSQITLGAFFERLGTRTELIYDTEKISRNFGYPEETAPILRSFCGIGWTASQLADLLDCLEIPRVPDVPPTDSVSRSETTDAVERLIYEQAVAHEREAADRKRHDRSDIPSDPILDRIGEQDLGRFLDRLRERTGVRTGAVPMLPVLSCLAQMADLGDVSLNVRFGDRGGSPVFYLSIRTTETALAIMPRKLSGYYRQFSLLARLYWRDPDFPDRVERYFRETVFSGDPDHKNAAMIGSARYFARLIAENRAVVDSMLNRE